MHILMNFLNPRGKIAKRNEEDGVSLLELVVFIAVASMIMATGVMMFGQMRNEAALAESGEATPAPTTVESSAPPVDIPVGTIFFGIISFIVIVTIGYFLFTWALNSKRKADHAKEIKESKWAENLNAWERLFAQHDELIGQWAEYELNVEMLIKYPVLTDVAHPKIQRLHKALQEASLSRPEKADRNVFPVDGAYGKAVVDLSNALTSAVNEAKKVAWSNFNTAERRRLSTAIQMLKMAQDAGASPNERQAAYKRVQAELDGLLVVPAKPMEVIEFAIRKTIEPAPVAA